MSKLTCYSKNTPEVLWAQRATEVYMTINLSDVTQPKIELLSNKVKFSGESLGKEYEFEIELFKEIDTEVSRVLRCRNDVHLFLDRHLSNMLLPEASF